MGFLSSYFWMFEGRLLRQESPFSLCNIISLAVSLPKTAAVFLLKLLLRVVFCANTCPPPTFLSRYYPHSSSRCTGLSVAPFFVLFPARIFAFHLRFPINQTGFHGDGHHLASSPCQVDRDSPGGTLCRGHLSRMCK